MLERLTRFALDWPKTVIAATILLTVLFGSQFPRIAIDTDPENMLEPDQPDRVFYDRVKKEFGIHDLIVVGIVDDSGVFRGCQTLLMHTAHIFTQLIRPF